MPETELFAFLVLVKIVTLALVLVLTHLTFRAYQLSGRPEIWSLSVGFAFMAVGVLMGGVVAQLLPFDIRVGIVVEGLFSAFGLGLVVYSLYGFR